MSNKICFKEALQKKERENGILLLIKHAFLFLQMYKLSQISTDWLMPYNLNKFEYEHWLSFEGIAFVAICEKKIFCHENYKKLCVWKEAWS